MKTRFTLTIFLFALTMSNFAQVGIGTSNPHASAMMDVDATNKGFLLPRMTTVQRSAIASPATGLQVYDLNTNSIWYFNGIYWVNTLAMASVGDVKSGVQSTDHSGWILLDGRALSSLSANQQAVALSLGFSGNLPNASNAYLVQNGGTIGSVTGSNTTILTQGNLPNVNFTGTAANAGSHTHSVDPSPVNSSSDGNHFHSTDPASVSTTFNGDHAHTISPELTSPTVSWALSGSGFAGFTVAGSTSTSTNGNHNHTVDIPATNSSTNGTHAHSVDVANTTSSTNGDHGHSVSVSSGGSGTPINIAPKSLTVNMFIYLGL